MARHRKKRRTHVGAQNGPKNSVKANSSASRAPKSMVIRIGAGEVGPSVSQLVQDVRTVMEPDTAIRLKVLSLCNLSARSPTLRCVGAKVKSITGLYYHGWSIGSFSLTAFFPIEYWKYKYATSNYASWTYAAFPR